VPLTTHDIEHMLARARARNQRQRITGLLLHYDGAFIQHIEGPEPQLNSLYADIRADHRHKSLIELMHEPVVMREFQSWSMGFSEVSAEQMRSLAKAPWNCAAAVAVTGRQLLRSFWQRHQHAAD
jgi:hypothetical protein